MPYAVLEDHKRASHEHYLRNKEVILAKTKVRKKRLQQEVRALKERPCMDCGVQYPYYVMQFDHRPDEEKVANVSRLLMIGARRQVLDEIKKCDLVCSNCHAVRTYSRVA